VRMIVLTKYSFFIKNVLSTSHADSAVKTPQIVFRVGVH
jgi:hypothetical protein